MCCVLWYGCYRWVVACCALFDASCLSYDRFVCFAVVCYLMCLNYCGIGVDCCVLFVGCCCLCCARHLVFMLIGICCWPLVGCWLVAVFFFVGRCALVVCCCVLVDSCCVIVVMCDLLVVVGCPLFVVVLSCLLCVVCRLFTVMCCIFSVFFLGSCELFVGCCDCVWFIICYLFIC